MKNDMERLQRKQSSNTNSRRELDLRQVASAPLCESFSPESRACPPPCSNTYSHATTANCVQKDSYSTGGFVGRVKQTVDKVTVS